MRKNSTAFSILILVGVFLAGSAVTTAATPTAHLRLVKSVPAADAVVSESPEAVRLYFSQRPEVAVSRINLTGPDGRVELGDVTRAAEETDESENVLVAKIPEPLKAGAYEVSWLTSSGDGHPIRGTFEFSVRAAASRIEPGPSATGSQGPQASGRR